MRTLPLLIAMMWPYVLVSQSAFGDDGLQVAKFSTDITPRLGSPVGMGFIPVLTSVEHPLLARGILLRDKGVTCVICTLDLMEIHNDSYDILRSAIGNAASVPDSRVALHCLHQHTAPAIDTAALRLQNATDNRRLVATEDYLAQVASDLTNVIRTASKDWQQITELGTGMGKVERVASNRRLKLANGTIQGRSSSTKSAPELRDLPEGLIDPWVRTVSLFNQKVPLAQLHFYASHPQSFYGDGRASYDVPGIIRERLEERTGAFQLYLTGCGGDIAFGKYNDGSAEARADLTDRLQAGIETAIANTVRQPAAAITWSIQPMVFPLRTKYEFSEAANRKILNDSTASDGQRRKAAIAMAWINRVKSDRPVELSCLSVGNIRLLHLPGEPFVQYQLAAQEMQPDRFVCVAGYGDCGMGYIGSDQIYTDRGGYEQPYAFSGPCEQSFLQAIRDLLAAAQ